MMNRLNYEISAIKTIRMSRANARKWLAALRSGEWQQGFQRLKSADAYAVRYCCLGVLEMVVSGECEDRDTPSKDWLKQNNIEFAAAQGFSSNEFERGLEAPWIGSMPLVSLNDSQQWPFDKIADAIEPCIEFID